jgi:hypothetical protein
MPDANNVIRYESPEVFETLTKEWTLAKLPRKPRRRVRGASGGPADSLSFPLHPGGGS